MERDPNRHPINPTLGWLMRSPGRRLAHTKSLKVVAARLMLLGAASSLPSNVTRIQPLPTGDSRILFIGNSLTYVNDLPRTFAQIASLSGDRIHVKMSAFPDYALADHLSDGRTLEALRAEHWDFVVMQQGPSGLPSSRDSLVLWAQRLAVDIRAAGARPALYEVWPRSNRMFDFPNVRESYRAAAMATKGNFIPAGEAWAEAWSRDPTLQLYGPDGFHPSRLGTYLAALVIYEQLTLRSALALPAQLVESSGIDSSTATSAATIRTLQQAAHAANQKWAFGCLAQRCRLAPGARRVRDQRDLERLVRRRNRRYPSSLRLQGRNERGGPYAR